MQQDTQNKMAAILQAAKDKAANKTVLAVNTATKKEVKVLGQTVKTGSKLHTKLMQQVQQFNDIQQSEVKMPELSTVTFADLIPNNSQPELPKLSIVDYSDRAFAVIGEDTKKFKDDLFSLGGNFNRFLKCGAGWIFSKKRMAEVQNHFHI